MAWYRAGTVTVLTGSTAVSGLGTTWNSKAKAGEALLGPDGNLYEIANISSDTSLELVNAYEGAAIVGAPYVIIPTQSYMKLLAGQVAELIALYQQVPDGAADALQSATEAAASAADALASKNAAATSASASAFSASDSAASAAAALVSKNAAATSVTSAANSATASANSATAAASSATAASTSKTDAAASATAALASKNAAATSETNAATSASGALSSKNAAATSATNAATSESNALSSKNAAATSATNAATSESNALASKNAAATSATNAGTSASTATTKASEAATSATNAATSATNAANSAADAAASAASIANGPVASFNTRTGAVTLTKADVTGTGLAKADLSLSNVDNTSDANKPISTATQTALNGKEPTIVAGTTAQYRRGDKTWQDFATSVRAAVLTGLSTAVSTAVAATDTVLAAIGKLQAQLNLKAPLDSPALTGAPTAPGPSSTDNSARIATTEWAKAGFAISLGAASYIKFPWWLGGWVVQFGSTVVTFSGGLTSTGFAMAFPNAKVMQVAMNGDGGVLSGAIISIHNDSGWGSSTNGIAFKAVNGATAANIPDGSMLRINWIAIGN